jgi:mono/diheme cytochrome c family protein
MMRWRTLLCCGLAALAVCAATNSWRAEAQEKAMDEQAIKRGDYLVNRVARCGDCHTPRNEKGEFDTAHHLEGAPTWFTSKIKFQKWETKAPDITMSGRASKWTEAKMVTFLSTGKQVDMPMPAYNLTEEDAKAVTAYLRSLPGKKK